MLFGHLIDFAYIYPGERDKVPSWVLEELVNRLLRELSRPLPRERLCRGTLLSREQYLPDIEERGYLDARLQPCGEMNEVEIQHWTEAINEK